MVGLARLRPVRILLRPDCVAEMKCVCVCVILHTAAICLAMAGDSLQPGKLFIYPWEVYPDMAVMDWYIRLSHKQRSV